MKNNLDKKQASEFEDMSQQMPLEGEIRRSESWYRYLFQSGVMGIALSDENYNFVSINSRFCNMLGYTEDELVDKTFIDITHPDDVKVSRAAVQKVKGEKTEFIRIENRYLKKNGQFIYCQTTVSEIPVDDGKGIYNLAIIEDISERKKAEDKLHSQAKFIDNLIESSALSTWISDENGTAIRANPACLEFFGAKAEEVVGKYNIFKDEVLIKQGLISELRKAYEKAEVVSVFIDYNFGEVKHVSVENATHKVIKSIFTPITDNNGKVLNVVCQTMDLTEIKKAESELIESEEKFRNMTEQISDIIFLTDDKGLLKYISPASIDIFGYNPQEMEGQLFMRYLKKTEIPKAMKQFLKTLSSGNPAVNMELLMKHKNGKIFHGELSGRLFKDNKLEGTIGVIRDITERKLAEEENLKLLTAVTQSPSIIAITDLHGNLEYVNPKFTELTGYSFEEAKGENVTILRSYEQSNEIYEELWQEISSGNEWRGEFYNKKKNGELFWESASVSPIIDKKGKTINYIKIAEDITERKKNEDQIKKDLKIKTALIQEIYHRTKNNMAVISAMISIQSRHTENDYVKSTFREINNKIQAMSLVHQKLYQSKNLSNIDFKEYVEDLAKLLMQSFGAESRKIDSKLELENVNILIDSAIPLGLILNELVSNIFKHAFPNKKDGKIFIRLFKDDDNIINLQLSDNGIGLPHNFDIRKDGSMGLSSVFSLVERQLKGSISAKSENGLKWHIKINDSLHQERV